MTPPTSPTNSEPFKITIRGIKQPLDAGLSIERLRPVESLFAILDILDYPAPEPVIQWQGRDRLCCLDVDYHALPFDGRPSQHWLECKAAGISPRPFAFHTSHGRGCKLFFTDMPGFTAGELAAVAAVAWKAQDRRATCDIVSITRHPRYSRPGYPDCGPVCTQTADADVSGVARMFYPPRDVDPEAVEELLAERGWRHGEKLRHPECLIDPNDTAAGTPVLVGDDGIYCHRCAAKELPYRGCGKPGFVPYGMLIDPSPVPGVVRHMIDNLTHWQQAAPVLAHYWAGQPAARRKQLYTVGMKLQHLGDHDMPDAQRKAVETKIRGVFCGPDVVRVGGAMQDSEKPGRVITGDEEKLLVNLIGAVSYPGEDGKPVARPKAKAALLGNGDATKYGHPNLRWLPSIDAHKQIGDPDTDTRHGVPAVVPADPPFKYRHPADREGAWEHLDANFPGINRNLVKTVIAALAYAQNPALTDPPRLLVVGQSKGGKSHGVKVGAELFGAGTGEASLAGDESTYLRACELAASRGVVITDECAKGNIPNECRTARALAYRRGKDYHRLFKGTAIVSQIGPQVFIDTLRPSWITDDRQTARRFVALDVGAGATCRQDWRQTSGGIDGWRARTPENTAAADAIVSEVLDEVRALGGIGSTFEQYAETLGCLTADRGADDVDVSAPFVELFLAAMATPDTRNSSFRGVGWKVFLPGDDSPLAAAWDACGDEAGRVDEQLITGRQWAKELGIDELRVAMVRRGRKIGLRWAVGEDRSTSARYGRDVILPGHPLAARLEGAAVAGSGMSGQLGEGSGKESGKSETHAAV